MTCGDSAPRHFKDQVLDELAEIGNVAQFVSFGPGPDPVQRYARVFEHERNVRFPDAPTAVAALMRHAEDGALNIRTFDPLMSQGREFVYGLRSEADVLVHLRRFTESGLFCIVNETVNVDDGGVSGVCQGTVIEFAPGATPRVVESGAHGGVASLPKQLGAALLEVVYGFVPVIGHGEDWRLEFSLHPLRRGHRKEHTILWERERVDRADLSAALQWPNLFSRFVGDKVFGLLVAHCIGLRVPRTTVVARNVAPFTFGVETGTRETWLRTCPIEQEPGRFPTQRGWTDPFTLLQGLEDRSHIASVLAQEAVGPLFSGAYIVGADGEPIIEASPGRGDELMLGLSIPKALPDDVRRLVCSTFDKAAVLLGPVRGEWAYDGSNVWVLQLHTGSTLSLGRTIYPGQPGQWLGFSAAEGLDALRNVVSRVNRSADGIFLRGNVGITSHMADLLRKARIPSRIEPTTTIYPGDVAEYRMFRAGNTLESLKVLIEEAKLDNAGILVQGFPDAAIRDVLCEERVPSRMLEE